MADKEKTNKKKSSGSKRPKTPVKKTVPGVTENEAGAKGPKFSPPVTRTKAKAMSETEVERPSTPKVAWMEEAEMTRLRGIWMEACESMLNSLRKREHINLINGLQIIIEAAERDFDHFNYGKRGGPITFHVLLQS